MGHEDRFRPPSLSGGCRLAKATFAGSGGKKEDASKEVTQRAARLDPWQTFRDESAKVVPPATATRRTAVTASPAPYPIEETTIAALHAAYVSGRTRAALVCQSHLDRIAAYDRKGPALGAVIINNPAALADAPSFPVPSARVRLALPVWGGGRYGRSSGGTTIRTRYFPLTICRKGIARIPHELPCWTQTWTHAGSFNGVEKLKLRLPLVPDG
jgi:hypothetical protein